MCAISESNVLIRVEAVLPEGLAFATEQFQEGWQFAGSVDLKQLELKIVAAGWSFVRGADRPLANGVGDTTQEAVASALRIALRRVAADFEAVHVQYIEVTEYPWFFLARLIVSPCHIRKDAVMATLEDSAVLRTPPRRKRSPACAPAMDGKFGASKAQLKEMLGSTRRLYPGQQ